MAFQLKEDAVAMEGFTRMNVSWESHAAAIDQIKDHVHALQKQEAKLKEARSAAEPWQRTAIDRIVPYLDELDGYTSAIIERITEQPKRLFTDEYKDFLEANADYATDLAGSDRRLRGLRENQRSDGTAGQETRNTEALNVWGGAIY